MYVIMYNPYRFGKYLELPKILKDKKSIINIKNDDDYCLLYYFGLYLTINIFKFDINKCQGKVEIIKIENLITYLLMKLIKKIING